MTVKVGDRLPEATLQEYIEVAVNIETGGKFKVSDAGTLLKQLAA